MEVLHISDSNQFRECKSFDFFYPSPQLAQEVSKLTFIRVFGKKIDAFSFTGLFYTIINRNFLNDMKVVEHPLILKNLLAYCKTIECNEIHFKLHKSNIEMYCFYSDALIRNGILSTLEIHTDPNFWVNSLTEEKKTLQIKNQLKLVFGVVAQFLFLLANALIPRKKVAAKKILFWHSFANNKEKIDYKFLEDIEKQNDFKVIHPNPYLFRSKSNWNKSIYFIKGYSMGPWKFICAAKGLFDFRNKLNKELAEFSDVLTYIPKKWNSTTTTKAFMFMLYNLLETGLIENIAKNKNLKSINIFRGGSAAGLIYSGMAKKQFKAKSMTNVLVPHGTELNILDHFSYFFLDYTILPSDLIVKNWEIQLEEKMKKFQSFNSCQLLAGGRIDYELLNTSVKKPNLEKEIIHIGIVLTYSSETVQDHYIATIKKTFEEKFGKEKCVFIIKPRPNTDFNPKSYRDTNVIIYTRDIFYFLSSIDIVIGTVSSYGVLSMVVTDGIYCGIPSMYFLNNPKFNPNNLGYSYHYSMETFTQGSASNLRKFIENYDNPALFLADLATKNSETKTFLTFQKNANLFLKEFIINHLN
jgi:hypothetical protein